jgi:hypothetical protein
LSSRDEGSGRWRAEPGSASSASGGHLSSEQPAGGSSLFEVLDEPLPSERARKSGRAEAPPPRKKSTRRSEAAATEAIPATANIPPDDEFIATRASGPRKNVRRRPALRRVKRSIRHVDPFSVLKLSLFFYACFLVLWLIFVAIVYSVLNSMGLFDAIEKFGRGLVLWEEVNLTLGFVERWALLVGFVFGVVASLINVVLAVLYNVGADLFGGLELTFQERDV